MIIQKSSNMLIKKHLLLSIIIIINAENSYAD